MLLPDMLKLSTRMFKTNPSRTWLTILGMGVGTGAVVLLVGLGFGLQGILLEQIVFGETLLSLNTSNPPSRAVVLNNTQIEKLKAIPNVKDVSPLAAFPALVTFQGLTGNVTLQGIQPAYFKYAGIVAANGGAFTEEDVKQGKKEIVLTSGALKLFDVEAADVVGKTVKFRVFVSQGAGGEAQEFPLENEYTVKGIVDNPLAIEAYIPLSELESKFAIPFYERAQVRVTKTDFLADVQAKLIESGFVVTALSKTVEQANKIFSGIQAVLALFGGIALIVSAIGMFNTMTVTLLERTAEIGIMRTIGASPTDIKVLFLTEAVIVGFLGGVVGIVIGGGIGKILNFALNIVAGQFGGVSMSLFRYPFLFLLFIMVFSVVVGFITGLFPANRAAKLNPLDAIRYK
jgi:putative ABC transport system permease protein